MAHRLDKSAVVLLGLLSMFALEARAQQGPPARPPPPPPVDDQMIEESVKRGVDYIWSKQHPKEFHWESQTDEEWRKYCQKNPNEIAGSALTVAVMRGGTTAVVLTGLLRSGISPEDERFRKALAWLVEQPLDRVYSRAMRAVLLGSLNRGTRDIRQLMEEDKDWLLSAVFADGTYGYFMPPNDAVRGAAAHPACGALAWRDLSNTQCGVLGVWLLSDAGLEVPEKYWRLVQHGLLKCQKNDGGWGYSVAAAGNRKSPSTFAMTLAGQASLFVIWDKLYAGACDRPVDPALVKAIKEGEDWLSRNFNPAAGGGPTFQGQFVAYACYGVERVGVASGQKYFGDKNWWQITARLALARQQKDGGWPLDYPGLTTSPLTAAYTLLFFAYGHAPVVFNKLAHGSAEQWNSRPRDLARLTTWMNRTYERLFNWQIMPIDRPVEELLDAPILLMSGKAAISLTDAQKAKLKAYVLGGGLLFGEAAGDSLAFANSFRALVRELFPELEMSRLPPEHPIYNVQFRLGGKQAGVMALPPLEGLGNGVRTMVLFSPRDIGCAWQEFSIVNRKAYFELGANLTQYVSDRGSGLLGRGTSYMIKDRGNKPARQATVGRVVWGGKYQWDPEPMAWQRADVELRNAELMGVTTRPIDLKNAVDARAVPLLHLTGVGPLELNDQQKANLKNYVHDGGLLLADAAGGSRAFADSFQKLAGELFGMLVPGVPPFLSGATDKGKVMLRHVDGLPRTAKPLEVLCHQPRPGRYGVIFLPYDLTAALAGYPNVEPVGLTPQAAGKLVEALLTEIAGGGSGRPTTDAAAE